MDQGRVADVSASMTTRPQRWPRWRPSPSPRQVRRQPWRRTSMYIWRHRRQRRPRSTSLRSSRARCPSAGVGAGRVPPPIDPKSASPVGPDS